MKAPCSPWQSRWECWRLSWWWGERGWPSPGSSPRRGAPQASHTAPSTYITSWVKTAPKLPWSSMLSWGEATSGRDCNKFGKFVNNPAALLHLLFTRWHYYLPNTRDSRNSKDQNLLSGPHVTKKELHGPNPVNLGRHSAIISIYKIVKCKDVTQQICCQVLTFYQEIPYC